MKKYTFIVFIYLVASGTVFPSLASAAPATYHPYWSLIAQTNISSLSNRSYNMSDGFGRSSGEFGYGAGIGAGIRMDFGGGRTSPNAYANSDNRRTSSGTKQYHNKKRRSFGGLYLAIEGFINADRTMHKKASRPYRGSDVEFESEEVNIYSALGARANIGYNLGRRFTIFGSAGLRHFEYESTYTYTDNSKYYMDEFIRYNDWKIAPSFGGGFIYSPSKKFDLVLGYEYSFFSIKDQIFDDPAIEGKVRMKINTIRLGVNYVF